MSRWLDIREDEKVLVWRAFGALLLISSGYTTLEAARDALFLTQLPARALAGVYLAVAALSFPVSAVTARLSRRLGPRVGLQVALTGAAGVAILLAAIPQSRAASITLYMTTAMTGGMLMPQFWAFAGRMLTVAQGRRLLGPIASAAVIGSVLGSATASLVLLALPVKALLVAAGAFFAIAPFALGRIPADEPVASPKAADAGPRPRLLDEPFLIRIALLVVLATAAALPLDYLFKWTVASSMPAASLPSFFARYYGVVNAASLVLQLFVGPALVRRLGVANSAAVTPFVIGLGAGAALLTGGPLAVLLVIKALDSSLRSSLHRMSTELLYLPLPRASRERLKPAIDNTGFRLAQAVVSLVLLGLGEIDLLSRGSLTALFAVLVVFWFAAAATLRRAYLAGLRRSLAGRDPDAGRDDDALDLAAVELLVERLASPDPRDVVATLRTLALRKRARLVPALVLHHPDASVLIEALDIFGSSPRSDWIALAKPLLNDARESVRIAAAHALALHGELGLLAPLAEDESGYVRGYAAVLADRKVTAVDAGGLRGMLAAIADLPPSKALADLLVSLLGHVGRLHPDEVDGLLARAAARQGDPRLVPELVPRLANPYHREAIRDALASLGDPAYDELARALADPTRGRALRMHVPQTLALFGSQRAADFLADAIEHDRDGMVRYKAIRGIGRLVADSAVKVSRQRMEALVYANLVEYHRLLGLRAALGSPPPHAARRAAAGWRILAGLLDDKLRQSLERAFRLLKVAYPREEIHRAHTAAVSPDARARANAAELVDTLLARRGRERLRELFAVAVQDAPPAERAARVARAISDLTFTLPETAEKALELLSRDGDATVASMAAAVVDDSHDLEVIHA